MKEERKEGRPPTSHEQARLSVWSLLRLAAASHPFCSLSYPSSSSLLFSLSSPSVYINLGRLHLYLMLPISSLILLTSAPSLSHLRGLHLAFFISRETHHPAESRSVRHAAPQVHPGRGGGFIVPLVMDSHDAVRHRRLSCKMAENLRFLKDPPTDSDLSLSDLDFSPIKRSVGLEMFDSRVFFVTFFCIVRLRL